jgi:hypothetical protein
MLSRRSSAVERAFVEPDFVTPDVVERGCAEPEISVEPDTRRVDVVQPEIV